MNGQRRYDEEVRRTAVRMVTEERQSIRAVVEQLGVLPAVLREWVRVARDERAKARKPAAATSTEVAQLLKERDRLLREQAILKKLRDTFAADPERYSDQ